MALNEDIISKRIINILAYETAAMYNKSNMDNLYMILLAVAPSIALIAFILLHDRYDKEPFGMLAKVFFFGMLASIPVLVVELLLSRYNFFSGLLGAAIQAFIVIGFTEEFFKRLVVVKTALFHKEFNEKLDGIVYCAMASLGFATVENVLYVIQFSSLEPSIWLMRAFLSVPTHMLLGIIMGYFLGLSRFGPNKADTISNYKKALIIPVVLHGAYDFVLMAGFDNYLYFFVPIVILLWVLGMVMLRKFTKASKQDHQYLHNRR